VGAIPKVDSKSEESTTKGLSNWYRVSRSSRTSGDTTPIAFMTKGGIWAMRAAGAPARALSRSARAWADSGGFVGTFQARPQARPSVPATASERATSGR
jgi:hypothetical protein